MSPANTWCPKLSGLGPGPEGTNGSTERGMAPVGHEGGLGESEGALGPTGYGKVPEHCLKGGSKEMRGGKAQQKEAKIY